MAYFHSIFSLTNFFLLSIALNITFLLKMAKEKQTDSTFSNQKQTYSDSSSAVINLDHGDPTMYEKYWEKMGEKAKVVINGGRFISYFSNVKNLCWFLEPELSESILRLHRSVGNAVVDGCYIVVGSGSSQLILAALYALSDHNSTRPVGVVSAAPYYSSYPSMSDFLKSGLYRWAGDAERFENDGPYIEFVTSPNNPDGSIRRPVVKQAGGKVVHDLAYYWPQYTAITEAADHELMLFTVSKCTGHAGSRIGWALVKDKEVAKRMSKFIELNTIGVSKEAQVRAARILEVVSEGGVSRTDGFFGFARKCMEDRWERLRAAVRANDRFALPEIVSGFCQLRGGVYETNPAFAWVKCNGEEGLDCEKIFRENGVLTRAGRSFGVDSRYVRVSILDRDRSFDLFVKRLSSMSGN